MGLASQYISLHESLSSITAKDLGKFSKNINKTSGTLDDLIKKGSKALFDLAKGADALDDDIKAFSKVEIKGVSVESDGSIIATFKAFTGKREFIELEAGIDGSTITVS